MLLEVLLGMLVTLAQFGAAGFVVYGLLLSLQASVWASNPAQDRKEPPAAASPSSPARPTVYGRRRTT